MDVLAVMSSRGSMAMKEMLSKSRDGRISEYAESPVMARNWGRKMMKQLEYVARGE